MITAVANIEEYYEEVKDQYNIDLEHFKFICGTPFRFARRIISSGILDSMRIQYLGTFEPVGARVKYFRRVIEEKFQKGEITKERYEQKIKMFDTYED